MFIVKNSSLPVLVRIFQNVSRFKTVTENESVWEKFDDEVLRYEAIRIVIVERDWTVSSTLSDDKFSFSVVIVVEKVRTFIILSLFLQSLMGERDGKNVCGDDELPLKGLVFNALTFYTGLYSSRVLSCKYVRALCIKELDTLADRYCVYHRKLARRVIHPFTRAELVTLTRVLVREPKAVVLWRDEGTLRVKSVSLDDISSEEEC